MEFLIWLVLTVASVIPMFKLLPHFGYDKLWAIACVIPIGTIGLLWLMAMKLQEMEKL